MKKIYVLLGLILSVLLILSACGNESNEESTTDSSSETDSTEEVTDEVTDDEKEEEVAEEEELSDSEKLELTLGEKVRVIEVLDGDTVTIENEDGTTETVQLAMVDAPKLIDKTLYDDPGTISFEVTSSYLSNFEGPFERSEVQDNKDGHTIGFFWTRHGSAWDDYYTVNELLLLDGYVKYDGSVGINEAYAEVLQEAETIAKDGDSGIWYYEGYVTEDGFDSSYFDW